MLQIDSFRGQWTPLSNYALCSVWFEGHIYNSVEHAYQAAKTLSDADRLAIRHAPTPNQAKKLGRLVPLRSDWDTLKLVVMEQLLREKFAQAPFQMTLLDSGTAELVEGNWWGDCFWGQCPVGQGENHLGRLLMKLRTELRAVLEP